MGKLECLRCDSRMSYVSREKIQLGQTGWLFGDLPNLLAGSLEVDIYACPKCRKVELFMADDVRTEGSLPQKICPRCGKEHDFDYPKCPFCKYDHTSGK